MELGLRLPLREMSIHYKLYYQKVVFLPTVLLLAFFNTFLLLLLSPLITFFLVEVLLFPSLDWLFLLTVLLTELLSSRLSTSSSLTTNPVGVL